MTAVEKSVLVSCACQVEGSFIGFQKLCILLKRTVSVVMELLHGTLRMKG